MTTNIKKRDSVSWKSHAGTAHGKVVEKLTKPKTIKGHRAAASPEQPQFLVETKEGKQAAHKPEALTKE